MQRLPFVMKIAPGRRAEVIAALRGSWGEIDAALRRAGVENFSVWSIQDFLFCYGEYPDGVCPPAACGERWAAATADCEMFAAPGTLPLMYHDIGVVRKDKSLIRHRVFATKLKDGCAAEYKRRHDALVEARGDKVSQGPESNFTIWNANGYIFGYCELVKSFDHEMTEAGARVHRGMGDAAAGDHGLADGRRGLDHRAEARRDGAGRGAIEGKSEGEILAGGRDDEFYIFSGSARPWLAARKKWRKN